MGKNLALSALSTVMKINEMEVSNENQLSKCFLIFKLISGIWDEFMKDFYIVICSLSFPLFLNKLDGNLNAQVHIQFIRASSVCLTC